MSAKDNGGPAFPVGEGALMRNLQGMTLRDAFALAALPQVMREWREDRKANAAYANFDSDAPLVAADCYIVADAMLKARKP